MALQKQKVTTTQNNSLAVCGCLLHDWWTVKVLKPLVCLHERLSPSVHLECGLLDAVVVHGDSGGGELELDGK